MPADFFAKQGDGGPAWTDHFTYPDGSDVDLTGANVSFVMRSTSATMPVTMTGQLTVIVPSQGRVQYVPSAMDTAIPGNYSASWVINFPNTTAPITLPTDGYLWVEIEPSLTAEAQQLVSLPDIKQWLRMDARQREYDHELLTLIEAARPEVEAIVGPVLPTVFDEWYEGGGNVIALTNRPSFGSGTSPLLTIIAASEYRGAVEYPLSIAASPVFGSIYSVMLNPALGSITRRSAGGAVVPFIPGRESVRVVYQAGQRVIPSNVRLATLEIVRVNFRSTAAVGRGFEASADTAEGQYEAGPSFWVPRRAREMLAPSRRAPSLA